LFINEIENVQPYHRAVTDPVKAHQIATLSIVSEDGGGSTLLTPQKEQKILKTEKVKTTTIDHYRLDNVGLIKLDIEGNELKALHGAKNTLERSDFPPIIFEANNDAWYAEQKESLFKYLNSLNYEIGEIRPFENMYVAVSQKHLQE
jgi:FkbM family methyltransferase